MEALVPFVPTFTIPIPLPHHVDLFGMRVLFPQDWSIQPFGVLVATGVLIGTHVAERRAAAVGLVPSAVAHCAAHVLFAAFVVAHVFDAVAYHPARVLANPFWLLAIWDGLSSFGGFLGATLGLFWYARRYAVDARVVADPIAFAFPFGWLFGRLGCFVAHDHPGSPTAFWLGVRDYAVGPPPYVARHDLGLYEVVWSAGVIVAFLALARTPTRRGFYLALLPLLYAPVRFGLDFLRATDLAQSDARYAGLTPGHYAALAFAGLGTMAWRWVHRGDEPTIPPAFASGHPLSSLDGQGLGSRDDART